MTMPARPPLLPYVINQCDPPELPARARGDQGGPEYVVTASITGNSARSLTLAGMTNSGETVTIRLEFVTPDTFHVLMGSVDLDPARVTLAREVSDDPFAVTIKDEGNSVHVSGSALCVRIQLDPFYMAYFGPDGRKLLDQNLTDTDVQNRMTVLPFGYSKVDGRRIAFHETFNAEPDEHFYGFGEKFTDFDKRGQRLEMWNYDAYGAHSERAYKNVPFFISTRGYGIFVDSVMPTQFDMACSNHSTFSFIVPDSALDFYVIAGKNPKEIIQSYSRLVSLPILLPKWAFGLWMSSGFDRDSAEAVVARAEALDEHKVPTDVLHLDCYWQRHGKWSDMQWDREMFPQPEVLLKQVRDMGYKVCLWINSYIGTESPYFEEAEAKGFLLKTSDGSAAVSDLWGGYHPPVGVVDMTHPEAVAWFKDLLRPLLRMGVDVFKSDFGEGVIPDCIAHNGMTGVELHNLYALLYNDAVAEVTAEETGHAGMVWSRSTFTGGQRHAVQWGGDTNATYQGMASTLRGGLSMGVCGHAFWSHDIGGFHLHPTSDLYIRWAQFGLFSPLSRAHGTTTRLPWDFGEEALCIFRKYVDLRYRLLPYLYSYGYDAHLTGLPMMRAMVLEFPDDPSAYSIDLQYMLGSELMVAPIFNSAGRRHVYFPAGRWIDFWTHEIIAGPQTRCIEAPLDVLPLYIRADSLIPTMEPTPRLVDEPFEFVTFVGYVIDRARFELRDLDGLTSISIARVASHLSVQLEGAKHKVGLRLIPLPGAAPVETIYVNNTRMKRVDGLEIGPEAPGGWTQDQDGTVRVMIRAG